MYYTIFTLKLFRLTSDIFSAQNPEGVGEEGERADEEVETGEQEQYLAPCQEPGYHPSHTERRWFTGEQEQ